MIGFRVKDRGWSVGLDQWVDIALKCRLIPASRFLVNVWILSELLLRVKQAGANVMVPVSAAVQSLDRDHVSVLLEDSSGENQVKQYDLVIVASGAECHRSESASPLEGATARPPLESPLWIDKSPFHGLTWNGV